MEDSWPQHQQGKGESERKGKEGERMSGILSTHLRDHVVAPTLSLIAEHTGARWAASSSAEMLIIGTAATETRCGHWLRQHPNGPGLGIYQMESWVHDDHWQYLERKNLLREAVLMLSASDERPHAGEMITNLAYATAMARVHYWRVPEALPDASDIKGLGEYWKRHYNSSQGAGSAERFVADFHSHARRCIDDIQR